MVYGDYAFTVQGFFTCQFLIKENNLNYVVLINCARVVKYKIKLESLFYQLTKNIGFKIRFLQFLEKLHPSQFPKHDWDFILRVVNFETKTHPNVLKQHMCIFFLIHKHEL